MDTFSDTSQLPKRGRGRPLGSKNRAKLQGDPLPGEKAKPIPQQYRESFNDVRAENEKWKAKFSEVAYKRMIGELVVRAEYDKALSDSIEPIISRLETLTSRIVSQVSEGEARRVQTVCENEVRAIRLEIANALRNRSITPIPHPSQDEEEED